MTDVFQGYDQVTGPAYDEMFSGGAVRREYHAVHETFCRMPTDEIVTRADSVASSYLDQGITFGVGGEERPFPLDIVPRLIDMKRWVEVEAGVKQRVLALEAFLDDIYSSARVLADGVIPRSVVATSPHYHRVVAGFSPPNGVRIHVSGIDLIRDDEGDFRVLEDNARVPSGVSYVMTNRRAVASALPEAFSEHRIEPVNSYPQRLLAALRAAAPVGVGDPTVVVLTPGVFNSAYFEHSMLARRMGIELVEGRDLVCRGGRVSMRTTRGLQPVHVIYRRIDDDFLDPVHFRHDSMLGVPGLINAARAGHVTIANAVGNGVADDKLLYTYVPDLIRYYLREEPILRNIDTWRVGDVEAREEVLDRLDELVLKPVDGSGGKGIVIGPRADAAELAELRTKILADPRAWVAQPVISLSTVPTLIDGKVRPRHVDLRPFAVNDGNDVWVLPGGLTRVALPEGELIVNSSRGGGSKDTWVISDRRDATPVPKVVPKRLGGEHAHPSDPGPALADLHAVAAGDDQGQQQQQQQQQQQGLDGLDHRGPGGVVLSRIAESLFWIGRYVERADVTARILDVQTQLLIEDPFVDEEESCRLLLGIMGVEHDGPVDQRTMLRLLLSDRGSDASIVATLEAARESARRARETLSTDMWSAINTTWRAISSGHVPGMRTNMAFDWVRERCSVINGVAGTTMSRDETWHFYVLGRSIERADMTARLLTTTALAGVPSGGWNATLRACGAYESFLRTYRGLEADEAAAEFLLLDRLFPRSIMSALRTAERCLEDLAAAGPRVGFGDEAQRLLGRARAELEYQPLAAILADLPDEMERSR